MGITPMIGCPDQDTGLATHARCLARRADRPAAGHFVRHSEPGAPAFEAVGTSSYTFKEGQPRPHADTPARSIQQ